VDKKEFDYKKARAQLQSATGSRAPHNISKLLDEEDMIDEREKRRAENRLMRRDYEGLAEDENYEMFQDPLDRYDEIIHEAPSAFEDERYASDLIII
jgi:hypothetical protein